MAKILVPKDPRSVLPAEGDIVIVEFLEDCEFFVGGQKLICTFDGDWFLTTIGEMQIPIDEEAIFMWYNEANNVEMDNVMLEEKQIENTTLTDNSITISYNSN